MKYVFLCLVLLAKVDAYRRDLPDYEIFDDIIVPWFKSGSPEDTMNFKKVGIQRRPSDEYAFKSGLPDYEIFDDIIVPWFKSGSLGDSVHFKNGPIKPTNHYCPIWFPKCDHTSVHH
uniref:Secreted protein n=1 Tax=Steinernema glaseri TaxID=37863 RepID=A0A1I7YNS6_9BILA